MKNLYKNILFICTLLLFGCGKNSGSDKSELTFFKVESTDFSRYINEKSLPENPNTYEDIAFDCWAQDQSIQDFSFASSELSHQIGH